MRPIEADGLGAGPRARGTTGEAGGLRAPGLDAQALWREVFAVESDEAVAPEHCGTVARSSSAGPRAATSAPGPAAAPHARGDGVPRRPAGTGAAPDKAERAAATGPSTPHPWTAAPPIAQGAAPAGPGGAHADAPCPPSEAARPAAPREVCGPTSARAAVAASNDAPRRACGDEPAVPGRAAGSPARIVDAGRDACARAPRESVQVHCSDGAVFVTVRDAGLAPADAIRCSLETAYALRGERAALRRVSLNGRTVYQRPGAVPGGGGGPPERLCFAC